MKLRRSILLLSISLVFVGGCITGSRREPAAALVTGEMKQWHDVVLTFDGPPSSETDPRNPFLDYRLNVTFAKGG